MITRTQITFAAVLTICCFGLTLAQGSLNEVRLGQCGSPAQLKTWIAAEEARGLVIDSRPFAINQAKGKLLFTRGAGRVSVVHMNPFVYDYKISVAQQELVSTALTDFLKLLLPQSLGSLPGLQSGEAGTPSRMPAPDRLLSIEQRLLTFNLAACNAAPNSDPTACAATAEMARVFNQIRQSGVYVGPAAAALSPRLNELINATIKARIGGGLLGNTDDLFASYTDTLTKLRNEQLETSEVCSTAWTLNNTLSTYDFDGYFQTLNVAQQEISKISMMAEDLKQLANDYKTDTFLMTKTVRCSGFNCTSQFLAYAQGVLDILGSQGYQAKLDALRLKGQEMQNMFVLTEQMRQKDGLFARTFEVPRKFELSEATITVKREKLEDKNKVAGTPGAQSGNPPVTLGNSIPTPLIIGGASNQGTEGNAPGNSFAVATQNATAPATAADSSGPAATVGGNNAAPTGQINEVIQMGRPRFMLSGGLVYSPLARRTFKSVKGFVLDAQGNPTGTGNTNVIGLEENSSRRLLPMVFLNTRLLDYEKGSFFFSFGVTGKRDDNIDMEYLVGPSVSFLNDRALFTFGAYGGLSQNLVSDVKLGDQISDDLGDAKFFRKGLTWKPGFSFSYSFSKTKKLENPGSGGGSANANELKNEIRLGGIPFNLAIGMAYTSLEQRTYDEIAGLARDRQGNLTNGHTITRIVGVTSSSNYRLTPLALLHSRLTNFGAHDFYFTMGVTGKKTDNNLNVEYLLGGSTNLYARRVFLTVGAFAGKQQTLGGNFFEGAALGKTQSVPTIDRFVWKPALSISYDISKIIPKSQ